MIIKCSVVLAVAMSFVLPSSPATAAVIACGSVLTADTLLTSDLDCTTDGSSGPALLIGASGITVDLGGHQVSNEWNSTGGIRNDGFDVVTIKNGRVAGGFHGIELTNGADDNLLSHLTGSSVSDVFYVYGSQRPIVEYISNAGTDNSHAVRLEYVTSGTVRNVTTNDGIQLGHTTDSTVYSNNIGFSDVGGINIYQSDRNVVRDNVVHDGSGANITIWGTGNSVLRNDSHNGERNIQIDATDTVVQDNIVSGGNLGIFVTATSTGTLVKGNSAQDQRTYPAAPTGGDGIRVESASTTVTANTAVDNTGWGIWVTPGTIDAGGNIAIRNGIGQCSDITCVSDGSPSCTITGTSQDDILLGTAADDVICGFGGNDTLKGMGGKDTLFGGQGIDVLKGGGGNDTISGEGGNDKLYGGAGNDSLTGGLDTDYCDGGTGRDIAATCEMLTAIP